MPSEAGNQMDLPLVVAHSLAEAIQRREEGHRNPAEERRMLALELRRMEEEHRSPAEEIRMLEVALRTMEVGLRSRPAAADSWGTFAERGNS